MQMILYYSYTRETLRETESRVYRNLIIIYVCMCIYNCLKTKSLKKLMWYKWTGDYWGGRQTKLLNRKVRAGS